jgi:hypothetical protein
MNEEALAHRGAVGPKQKKKSKSGENLEVPDQNYLTTTERTKIFNGLT